MFSYLFPKGSLGIEITTKYVRFVHLSKRGDKFRLENFGRIMLQTDIFFEGVLKKPEELYRVLKNILRESHEKQIRISIPGDSQRFFSLKLPQGNTESLVDDIIFHLKEHVLFHEGKDALADVRIINTDEDSVFVRTVVVPLAWFQSFKKVLSVFSKSNLHIEGSNQASVLASYKKEESKGSRLHVQFGDDTSSFSVIEHGKIVSYQEFPFSTHRFLLEVQKRLTKPSEVASSYLSHLGILGADVREFSENSIAPIAFLLDHAILEYGRETGNTIQEVTLGGTFGGYRGVSQIFTKHLRISVHEAYPWKTFDYRFDDSIFAMKKHETLEYLTALGLSLDGMK